MNLSAIKSQNLVTFAIGNAKTKIENHNEIIETHNMNVTHCIHNYVKVGNVVVFDVVKKGNKASDTFYAAIRRFEETFNVRSEFINGSYMALILSPNLKAL